jgi:hypothetical protein
LLAHELKALRGLRRAFDRAAVAIEQLTPAVIGLAIGTVLDLEPTHAALVGIALALGENAPNVLFLKRRTRAASGSLSTSSFVSKALRRSSPRVQRHDTCGEYPQCSHAAPAALGPSRPSYRR